MDNMQEIQKRDKAIDIFKGLGILFVIIAHVGYTQGLYFRWCSAFYMPMFFFISGYLFHDYEISKFIKRKVSSLLVPYLVFGGLNLIACLLMIKHFDIFKYLKQLFYINNEPALPITGALWFLTCLFGTNIMFYVFNRYLRKYLLEAVIIFLVLLVYLLNIKLPYSFDSAIYMLPVFYIGYKYKYFKDISNPAKITVMLILLTMGSFLIFKNGTVNVRMNTYNNILLFYTNTIIMSFAFLFLSELLEKFKWFFSFIEYFGKNSLIFMCVHQSIIYFILKIAKISLKPLILIITMSVVIIVTELWNRIRIKIEPNLKNQNN